MGKEACLRKKLGGQKLLSFCCVEKLVHKLWLTSQDKLRHCLPLLLLWSLFNIGHSPPFFGRKTFSGCDKMPNSSFQQIISSQLRNHWSKRHASQDYLTLNYREAISGAVWAKVWGYTHKAIYTYEVYLALVNDLVVISSPGSEADVVSGRKLENPENLTNLTKKKAEGSIQYNTAWWLLVVEAGLGKGSPVLMMLLGS